MMNGRWKKLALAGLVGATAALGACGDDTAGTGTGDEACSADTECPTGYRCDQAEGLCVVDGNSGTNQNNQGTNQNNQGTNQTNQGTNQNNQGTNQTNQGTNQNNQNNQTNNQNNQGNNQNNSTEPDDRRDGLDFDESCVFLDRDDSFEPQEIWSFQVDSSIPYATYDGHGGDNVHQGNAIDQVMATPVVLDLDNGSDGVPDVVFTTFATNESDDNWDQLITGVLRAVDGVDGSHKWSVGYEEIGAYLGQAEADWNPALGFMPAASVATGDIDNDGNSEIVAGLWNYSAPAGEGPRGLIAIDHDGEILWITDEKEPQDISNWWGGPSIADLNGDGSPQIVIGSVVYDNTGELEWDGRDASGLESSDVMGSNFSTSSPGVRIGPLSIVSDVTGNGEQEVITGRAVFNADGSLLWESTEVAPDGTDLEEGFTAVADFEDDDDAEVVVVSAGTVRIHDGATGTLLWGPVDIPGAGRLGAPTVADMTGDGNREIGVAGSNGYFVLAVDASDFGLNLMPDFASVQVWSEQTQDFSSNTTGSSVFDFNGDGTASVVYNDELYLRVFDGPTGDVIFEAQNPSFTALENPVIVDVNNDGAANIVVPASDFECGDQIDNCTPGRAGLHAYGDADDNWVTTRRVWNQHAYCVNNIEDDGAIPASPTANYAAGEHNTFRLNTLTEIEPQAAPDLLPDDPAVSSDGCTVLADVWVTNGGAVQVGPEIPVSLYATNGVDRHLITVGYTQAGLAPGESERLDLDGTIADPGQWDIEVVVDDDGGVSTRNECDAENNALVVAEDIECTQF